jgi:hypothetical protein
MTRFIHDQFAKDYLEELLNSYGEVKIPRRVPKTKLSDENLAKLWILTPTASSEILAGFNVNIDKNWENGIYFLGASLRSAIVVIHQLPQTPETLWLRLLGRGKVQKQAIDELEALPPNHPYRASTLKVLYALEKNLEANQPLDEDEKELVMRLAPLYEQDRERAIEQGIQQGQKLLVENLLRTRFGELDAELSRIIDLLLTLPPEEFTPLLLQLSREELLSRFQAES